MPRIRRAIAGLFDRADSQPAKPAAEDGHAPAPAPPVSARAEVVVAEAEPTVDERGARAILASMTPPLPPEPQKRRVERTPPAPPPLTNRAAGPTREWNVWELQRAVREAPGDEHHEEWSALLIHLREFANADGDLPAEFDGLVRESFGPVLDQPEPATKS